MGKKIVADDSLLSAKQLSAASSITVQDSKGAAHTFGSLISGRPTTLILVRHWHCGFCSAYLSDVAGRYASIASEAQVADPKGPQVIVVGHGGHEGIDRYRTIIPGGFPFPIYADPKRKLYKALGVVNENLDMGKSQDLPQHVRRLSAARIVLTSTIESLTSGRLMWKGGAISVLGADFVFDAQGNNTYTHRMINTRDHTDVDTLAQKAGIDGGAEKKAQTKGDAAPVAPSGAAVEEHAAAIAGSEEPVAPAHVEKAEATPVAAAT